MSASGATETALELLPKLLSLDVPLDKERCSTLLNYRHSILPPRKVEEFLSWEPSANIVEQLQEISSDEGLERVPVGYKYEEDGQYVRMRLGGLYLVLKEESDVNNDNNIGNNNDNNIGNNNNNNNNTKEHWKFHNLQLADKHTNMENTGWYTNQDMALDAFILTAERVISDANANAGKHTEQEKEDTANKDFWADFSDESGESGESGEENQGNYIQDNQDTFYTRQAEEHISTVDDTRNSDNQLDRAVKMAIGGIWGMFKESRTQGEDHSNHSDPTNQTTDEERFLELVLQSLNA
ncbi:hypothetical protein E3P92_02198 [Wallemia ichthyophaga]|nr:hypothetical protein E3P91_01949 [Wallemia ichthyophaga]TIB13674.1 hypothetical protein E3P92_02198 [Wallemia ichthyophaga]